MIDGIRWRLRTGAPWRDLPAEYGPWQTESDRLGNMTALPKIGSIWARRYPGFPQHDRDFRVTGVFAIDGVTYVETERLDNGDGSRGRLEHVFEYAECVSTNGIDTPHGGDIGTSC